MEYNYAFHQLYQRWPSTSENGLIILDVYPSFITETNSPEMSGGYLGGKYSSKSLKISEIKRIFSGEVVFSAEFGKKYNLHGRRQI